jgi:hypothetical protein
MLGVAHDFSLKVGAKKWPLVQEQLIFGVVDNGTVSLYFGKPRDL